MKDIHLVPVNIQDIVEKLNSPIVKENERLVLQKRLEVIKDYVSSALNRETLKTKRVR